MKKIILILLTFNCLAQNDNRLKEVFPVFDNCTNLQDNSLKNCFYNNVENLVYNNFKVPEKLIQNNFTGIVKVLFEVDANGNFNVLYVESIEKQLIDETKKVIYNFPKIKPATYNGQGIYSKYTLEIAIPLVKSSVKTENFNRVNQPEKNTANNKKLTELDSIERQNFEEPKFKSDLNIPFSHQIYSVFDQSINQLGSNNHTASKPLNFQEVAKYYHFEKTKTELDKKAKNSWVKKLWNSNLVEIQGNNYWFTINPILDLQLGKSIENKSQNTYLNTRGITFQGGLGRQLNFTTTVFESQGKFADYYTNFSRSMAPAGGNPAVIPGIGIAKDFKDDSFDFPSADANLSFTPSQFMNFQLGYGRNFIGDGYRSLLESDGASPYPYFKINTTFWKIKYTNTYLFLKDITTAGTIDRTPATKFMANHYLSYNITNRLNIGLFESVVWANDNGRGFDMNFANPIIFYRTVEFSSGARTGNALLGMTAKFKINNKINTYGQLLLDEFSLADMTGGNKSWKNKYGFQWGIKYYNAFAINNLTLQLECNYVRPYVYSHQRSITNYGHNNQNIGHQWGANFEELIAIARYHSGRFYADVKLTYAKRGLDFDPATNNNNYGSNIYISYDTNRPFENSVLVGQGNETKVLLTELQAGFTINTASNLKLFGNLIYRNFNPTVSTLSNPKDNATWFSFGIRSDVFNHYFDY